MGVAAAPTRGDGAPPDRGEDCAMTAEAVRRELGRLTALLRRHFSAAGEDSLLPALVDTSDPAAASSARAFLAQIRTLADALHRDSDRWSASRPAAGAFADFRRETMALLEGVEQRIGTAPS